MKENNTNPALEALGSITKSDESVTKTSATENEFNASDIIQGKWYDFEVSKFAEDGKYYKDGIRFQVQAASVKTIKYFSAMDENNHLSVRDAIYKLIGTHIRVIVDNKVESSLDHIYEHDQLRAILLINMYTGTGSKLSAKTLCQGVPEKRCNTMNNVDVALNTLTYNVPSEKGYSLFNKKRGTFVIEPKGMKKLEYRFLTLAESAEVTSFISQKHNDGDTPEKQFSDFAGFYMHKKKADETMDAIYAKYLKDSNDKLILSAMTKITSKDIDMSQKTELQSTCSKCGRFHSSPITEFGDIKNVFLIPDTDIEY